MMDSTTIYEMAMSSGSLNNFDGVFPADMLRKPKKYPSCFIANTDDSTRTGEHWVAFNFPDSETMEYFDSYGYTPYIYPLFNLYIVNIVKPVCVKFNEKSVQSKTSKMCGLHCLFFLIKRCENEPFTMIMDNEYSTNKCLNDCIVLEYFHGNESKGVKLPSDLISQKCICKYEFEF